MEEGRAMWECQALGAAGTERVRSRIKLSQKCSGQASSRDDDGRPVSKGDSAPALSAPTMHPSVPLCLRRLTGILQAELRFAWEFRAYGEGKEVPGWRSHPEGKEGGSGEKGRLVRPSPQQALQ